MKVGSGSRRGKSGLLQLAGRLVEGVGVDSFARARRLRSYQQQLAFACSAYARQ